MESAHCRRICECERPPVRWRRRPQTCVDRSSREELPGETESPSKRATAPSERRSWRDSCGFQFSARSPARLTLDKDYGSWSFFFARFIISAVTRTVAHWFVTRWLMTTTTTHRLPVPEICNIVQEIKLFSV